MLTHECKGNASYKHLSIKQENIDLYYKNKPRTYATVPEYVVVSGLALGCDAAAHQGCLDAKGRTIAVVATGLDITHPRENKALQNAILDNDGLLLSEQIIGVKANPKNLVARNRLQAALSEEVIVVQCPIQSGTMHTVRFAQKYGKKIYAVHSNKYDAKSSGNECLLEEGIASPL